MKIIGTTFLALLVLAPLASGQRMLELANGERVEARIKSLGRKQLLKTAFGIRTVTRKEIGKRESVKPVRAEYRIMAAAIPEGKIAEHQAVAQWCLKAGYLTGLREQLNTILAKDVEDAWAGKTIKDLCTRYLAHESESGTRGRDRRKFFDYLLDDLAAKDLVGAVMAREKAAGIPEEISLRPSIKAMKARAAGTRWLAAQILRPFRNRPDRIVRLYRCCLCDTSPMVRREAVKSLEITKDPVFVKLFSKNLVNPSPQVRINAAEALGAFGMKEAVVPLIVALQDSGRPTRSNVMRLKHQAYVKDFDVEIAQAAVIADPIVDIATEGIVLDVGFIGVHQERRAFSTALSSLTGASFGSDAAAWANWWKKEQAKQKKQ